MLTEIQKRLLWNYVLALLVGAIGYIAVFWWSKMHGLSVAAAFILGLITFLCARVIQTRGKLSLKVTIFVLPLVTAMLCIGLQQMNPYLQRQRANIALKRLGLKLNQTKPQVEGEWYRDRSSGAILPFWLVRMFGEDATNEVTDIYGSLEAIQSVDLRQLQLPHVGSVTLSREGAIPPLSVELITFLTGLAHRQELRLEIFLEEITFADMPALKELNKLPATGILEISSFAHKIQSDVDLAVLPAWCWLRLNGDKITLKQAEQIKDLKYLQLLVNNMSADVISTLGRPHSKLFLVIHNIAFDQAAAQAIMHYQGNAICLVNCKFPDPFEVDEQKCNLQMLTLENTPIAESVLLKWLRKSDVSRFQTESLLSSGMLDQCKQIESLQRIYYEANGEWVFLDLSKSDQGGMKD